MNSLTFAMTAASVWACFAEAQDCPSLELVPVARRSENGERLGVSRTPMHLNNQESYLYDLA